MNRFAAESLFGRPIVSVEEGVQALATIGVTFDLETTLEVLRDLGIDVTRETAAALIVARVPPSRVQRMMFSSAFQLGPFVALCRQTDSSLLCEATRYLITAAPGHL